MKVLLFYGEEDQALAEGLLKELAGQGVAAERWAFKGGWKGAPGGPAPAGITHAAAAASVSPEAWFGFAAGFVLGSGLPLICCGPGFSAPSFSFGNCTLTLLGDEKAFGAFIEKEYREWTAREAPARARKALLDLGIPVSEESFQNYVTGRNTEAAALFIAAGFSPGGRNRAGVSLLSLAARSGDREMVRLLLKAGADVNQRAADRGGSALIDAALGKYHGIMEDLLAAGADTDIKSKDGQSALIIAAGLGDEAAAELLLKAGANADEPDSLGASARTYVKLFKKPAMEALFDAYTGK